jgi:uncharacterized SAM-binding protein YcdF (DUF218 family)
VRLSPPRPLTLALAGAAAILGLGAFLLMVRWLERSPDPQAPADVIVVLGGDHPARTLTAIDLYERGLAPALWLTGDVPAPGRQVSVAEAARYLAFTRGIPYERQLLLPSTSTWEDAAQIRTAVEQEQVRSLLVVTSWYHSRRALCVINHHLADLDVLVSYTPSTYTLPTSAHWWKRPIGWWHNTREALAFVYYGVRYGLPPWSC